MLSMGPRRMAAFFNESSRTSRFARLAGVAVLLPMGILHGASRRNKAGKGMGPFGEIEERMTSDVRLHSG